MSKQEVITLRSSIRPALMRYVLLRGTVLAACGVLLLMIGGIFLKPSILNTWGFLIWLASFCLIAFGLIPYRRLCRLELHPYELHIVNDESVFLVFRGKTLFSCLIQEIVKMEYLEEGHHYGIGLWLRDPSQGAKFDKPLRWKCDCFLPYFSSNSFQTLKNCSDAEDYNPD